MNTYLVAYRRVKDGMLLNSTITVESVKRVVEIIEEVSTDTYEIILISKVL